MRLCLCLVALAFTTLYAAEPRPSNTTLRGKLQVHEGKPPSLETPDHKTVALDGDETARKILNDNRVNGFDVEVKGRFTAPNRFVIDPSHTHSMLVHQNGRLKMITYWCDICSIRSYTPGPCVCCQKDTEIELQDPDHFDRQ